MKNLIARMENLSNAWKTQFARPSDSITFAWAVDVKRDILTLNGRAVCRVKDIASEGEGYCLFGLHILLKHGLAKIMIGPSSNGITEIQEIFSNYWIELVDFTVTKSFGLGKQAPRQKSLGYISHLHLIHDTRELFVVLDGAFRVQNGELTLADFNFSKHWCIDPRQIIEGARDLVYLKTKNIIWKFRYLSWEESQSLNRELDEIRKENLFNALGLTD